MKHIWMAAALSIAVGCATEPAQDDAAPDPDGDPDPGPGSTGVSTPFGCDVGVRPRTELSRFARGGQIELDLENTALFSSPRTVMSSAPAILGVSDSGSGALLTGVAPGTAALEVWRCGHRIASFPITVVPVAEIEVRLSLGPAGRSAPLTALAAIPGSADQLEITYFDDRHVALAGLGAARFAYAGGIRPTVAPALELYDSSDRIPHEYVPIAIDGPGRFTATAGALEAAVEIATTPAPAHLALQLKRLGPITTETSLFALVALGETEAGQPIAGLAPAFTVAPADALTPVPTDSPRRFQLLLGQPHGPVTFTATAGGATADLTETFP